MPYICYVKTDVIKESTIKGEGPKMSLKKKEEKCCVLNLIFFYLFFPPFPNYPFSFLLSFLFLQPPSPISTSPHCRNPLPIVATRLFGLIVVAVRFHQSQTLPSCSSLIPEPSKSKTSPSPFLYHLLVLK